MTWLMWGPPYILRRCMLSLSRLCICRLRRHLVEVEGGQRGGEWGGGGRAQAGWGGGSERDE